MKLLASPASARLHTYTYPGGGYGGAPSISHAALCGSTLASILAVVALHAAANLEWLSS